MTIPVAPDGPQPDAPITDYYAKVPRSVLTDARLSDRAVRLWALLDSHLLGKPYTIKVATLAVEMGATTRSTERALSELVALGYVIRSRTRSVSVTAVRNPARSATPDARSATPVGCDPTQVADTSRTRPLRTTDNSRGPGVTPAQTMGAPALAAPLEPAAERRGDYLEPYLRAVIEGAGGADIELNGKVRRLLQQIAAGMSPEQLRELVAGWPRISWTGEPIYRLDGFIVGVVLPGIAAGKQAPAARPTAAVPSLPPTPEELRRMDRERELREAHERQRREELDAALSSEMDELVALADQYGIKSPIAGVAAARAALRSAGA